MKTLAEQEKLNKGWSLLGWSGMLAGVLILSYSSVIAGWSLAYVLESVGGGFTGISREAAGNLFSALISDPLKLIFWHSIFIIMTMIIVARGVSRGLEVAVKYLMPALAALILVLIAYAISQGSFMLGVTFMFTPDFSKINQEVLFDAMGQAFFSLSLGMGAIMIYGSYLPQRASIAKTSFAVALADTSVAVLAGLAIFPIVFAHQLEAGQGPGLIFNTLPLAFGQMSAGLFFGTLFFVLLVFAAWTSSISLIEPAVAWLVEKKNMTRVKASVICGLLTWLLGLGTVFSFNLWASYTLFEKTFFDLLDFLTSNIMLPLGGLFIAIFVAWRMRENSVRDEMAIVSPRWYRIWRLLLRFVTPVGIFLIFLRVVGII